MAAPATSSLDGEKYAKVTFLDRITWASMRRAWSRLTAGNLQQSYVQDVLPAVIDAMTVAQFEAATIGVDYGAKAQVELGAGPGVTVRPRTFAGVASDGRSLSGLMVQPLIDTLVAANTGTPVRQAMAGGLRTLERITVTQVHDAAREAESVGMVGNDNIRGYLRVVEPGACSRCIILSGKFYRWNSGFLRHPQCRCGRHQVLTGSFEDTKSPQEIFNDMSREQQNRIFTNDGAEAIRLGADIGRVVNARKGMTTTTSATGREVKATTSVFGQQLYTTTTLAGNIPRPMPQSILTLAGNDRELAVRLLQLHDFII